MKLPHPDQRNAVLFERRNLKMARSPHAYMRGNTVKFYEWLQSTKGQAMPLGPPLWICGDCHSGNLGPLANAEGKLVLEIRDFDQTVIGNPAHDLVRLALSLATAARGSSLPGVVTARMLENIMQGYQQAFNPDSGEKRPRRPAPVRWTMRQAAKRTWKQLAIERIAGMRPSIPLSKNFWPLSSVEKDAIHELFACSEVLSLVRTLRSRNDDAQVEVMDAAYWVKGCSSLGLLRYAVLLKVGEKKDNEFCLIDIKQAVRTAGPRYNHVSMPRDNAHRVVTGARKLSPALGDRMAPQRFLEHGVVLRELLPQDLKLEIDELTVDDATKVARYLANVVGHAHARQMDDEAKESWRIDLTLDNEKALAAPDWLWDSTLQLAAEHETGYLEHCRKYALSHMSK
jgi:uncharacterized protein (DUF2252 family)